VIPIDGRRRRRQTVSMLDLVPDDRHQAPTRDAQIHGFPPSCRPRGSAHTPSWVVRMRRRLTAPGLPLTVPPFSNSDEPLLHPTQNPKVFGLTFARDAAASWVVSIFSEVGALFFLPPSSSSSSAQTSVNGLNQTRTCWVHAWRLRVFIYFLSDAMKEAVSK
jgi:hypothetical protein